MNDKLKSKLATKFGETDDTIHSMIVFNDSIYVADKNKIYVFSVPKETLKEKIYKFLGIKI